MRARIILSNCNVLICVLDHRASVVVHVQVVGGREDGDDGGEVLLGDLLVHCVSENQGKRSRMGKEED